jgi:hypothetical protein
VLADYPASDGWSLSYILVSPAAQIVIAAAADGSGHLVSVAPATTAAWAAGIYTWQERASKAGAIHTSDSGSIEILPNFSAAAGGLDARTHAQKTLAAIESWLETGDITVADYTIGDRQLKRIPIRELLLLRDTYRRDVRRQTPRQSGRVYVRF